MNIKVTGFSPYPAQKEWIEKIEDLSVKYACLIIARQTGKSLLLVNLALKWSLENNGVNTMIVSPVYSQSRKIFEDIERVIAGTPLLVSSNKSNYEMGLINGSKIIFRSAEKPDNMRGYTNDYLLIDESAFIRNSVWEEILRPTILVKGRKVVFASTPKDKSSYLYKLYLAGLDPDKPEYISINGSSYLNPYIKKEDLDDAKKTMPEDIFQSEVMGQFTDGGGSVFKNLDNYCVLDNWGQPTKDKKFYAGIDVGRQMDYSVLTILDDKGNVVFIHRENNNSWDNIIENISKHLQRYNASAMMEVNGIGDPLYEQLKKKYRNIEPFITSNQSKQQIIEDLIYELNVGELRLPSQTLFNPLFNELNTFTYSYSPQTRKVQYKAIDGAHDDCVMSLAISLHALKQRKTKGVYHIY